jgi:hypothetical protein
LPNGNVPTFFSRDRIYNDIAAPGQEIWPYRLDERR